MKYLLIMHAPERVFPEEGMFFTPERVRPSVFNLSITLPVLSICSPSSHRYSYPASIIWPLIHSSYSGIHCPVRPVACWDLFDPSLLGLVFSEVPPKFPARF